MFCSSQHDLWCECQNITQFLAIKMPKTRPRWMYFSVGSLYEIEFIPKSVKVFVIAGDTGSHAGLSNPICDN
jgi:hypothetical protein